MNHTYTVCVGLSHRECPSNLTNVHDLITIQVEPLHGLVGLTHIESEGNADRHIYAILSLYLCVCVCVCV